ncbi:MAG: type I DNA topoisomerase [Candidatus Aegiribacteria sp.]|nr:type I DNA topoisomerase [Candidatus Aegiribacteria sp.]
MSKKKILVIIESPAKARSLRGYLGDSYEIIASNGHVRDLPRNYLGVDETDDFKPTYSILPEKRKTVARLKKMAQGYSRIYLAADPDREGEAICWHLSQILERKGVNFSRLRFNAITKDTILGSLKKPSSIDMRLVDAQQARRVMDRLVGYKVSSWLQRIMGKGKSAGRVQSVALRMIQEREDIISSFLPVEYWLIDAKFIQENIPFTASLCRIDEKPSGKPGKNPGSEIEAERIIKRMKETATNWKISKVISREKSITPPPPFITSTLQQTASNRLAFSPSRTMSIAQQLYEGISLGSAERTGLITYMRTDSVRMSPESLKSCREYLADKYGSDALPAKARRYRSSKGSQDAHEAIRPVDIRLTPGELESILTPSQSSLYRLIWNRFAATQLNEAKISNTSVTVSGAGLEFSAIGEILLERGFSIIDPAFIKTKNRLPELSAGKVLLESFDKEQKFTSPPPRFSEARLVAEMKKVGIGRPSTYVSTIKTLRKREYVEKDGKVLKPTELGTTSIRLLVRMFPHIFKVDFTARMEELLDSVAKGTETYSDVLKQLSLPLESSLQMAMKNTENFRNELQEETGETCPECGAPIIIRWGRYGKFKACTSFPRCRYSKPVEEDNSSEYEGRKCPECGSSLLLKTGRYGKYLSCSNHPKCKHTEPVPTGVPCPASGCTGELVEKKSRRGRLFYACNRYPECKYAVWNMPLDRACPRCGFPILVEKNNKKGIWCPECRKKIVI